MAEFPMNGSHGDSETTVALGTLANWAGAIVSLALVAGAITWGHTLLSRDVSGVPVVRSLDGPMRVQPSDPGGSQAAHQGLSVNNVAAAGVAQAPGDRLVLAPNSVDLTKEDQTLSAKALDLAAQNADRGSVTTSIAAPKPIDLSNFGSDSAAGNAAKTENADPLVEQDETYGPKIQIAGLQKSLRPKLRPVRSQISPTGTATDTSAVATPGVLDGSTLAEGTRLVQLGAFASAEIAQAEWTKLQSKFSVYLGDKDLVIQKASSGGKVFYRLRALGFADLSDARRLCSALKAQNADCIPVVVK